MSEIMDLVVIEKKNAMAVFTNNDQLDPLIEAIEKEARSLVPDVTTKKGRDAIASMAHKVARSKTYIDNAGKDLVAELKALPKQIDESRRVVRERLDALKDEVRRPLTEWEAEQERIKAEEAMNALHVEALAMNEEFDRQLAARIESDHEMALLMNDAFDREQADKAAEAERQRIAHEEEIKRMAAAAAAREHAVLTATNPLIRFIGSDDMTQNRELFQVWLQKLAQWHQTTTPYLFLHTPDIAQAPELVHTLWEDLRKTLPEIGAVPAIPQQSSLF
ncbi:hypothetical protein OU570_17405 [Escherichia coli]|nr:hypothetical protein [Escherichia coli]